MVRDLRLPFGQICVAQTVRVFALLLCFISVSRVQSEQLDFASEADAAFAELHLGQGDCEACGPDAADFGEWETIVERSPSHMHVPQEELLPFDWFRHFGFRHSSSHGRNVGKGLPLDKTSWLNRPIHADWFIGPLLGDDLITDRVTQTNVLLGGFRLGFDFDHYWGAEWRFGWANPNADFASPLAEANDVSYVVSDVDLMYYPWGDSKVRPYGLIGFGVTQLDFQDDVGLNLHTTLATLPFGAGIKFQHNPWMAWRLEALNNLAFGDDRVSTMNNISLTAGVEMRFGAKPATYWPWRTSRRVW